MSCVLKHNHKTQGLFTCAKPTHQDSSTQQGQLHCRAKINSIHLVVVGFLCDNRWMDQVHDKIYSLYIQHFHIGTKKKKKTLGTNAAIPAKCKKGSLLTHNVLELITVVCECACLEILNEV